MISCLVICLTPLFSVISNIEKRNHQRVPYTTKVFPCAYNFFSFKTPINMDGVSA